MLEICCLINLLIQNRNIQVLRFNFPAQTLFHNGFNPASSHIQCKMHNASKRKFNQICTQAIKYFRGDKSNLSEIYM